MIHLPKKPTRAQQEALYDQLGSPWTLTFLSQSADGSIHATFEDYGTVVIAPSGECTVLLEPVKA